MKRKFAGIIALLTGGLILSACTINPPPQVVIRKNASLARAGTRMQIGASPRTTGGGPGWISGREERQEAPQLPVSPKVRMAHGILDAAVEEAQKDGDKAYDEGFQTGVKMFGAKKKK